MTIRPAAQSDIDAMCRIIGRYAAQGIMLPRSRTGLLDSLPHYMVAEIDGSVVGCGGLQPYTTSCGEIYGLATADCESPRGTGTAIVNALLEKCSLEQPVQSLCAHVGTRIFRQNGFSNRGASRSTDESMEGLRRLSEVRQRCDEIAMVAGSKLVRDDS